jgi:hypothetical protein
MRYPYILPSVVSGILSLISWLVALLFLKESNKAVIQRKQAAKKEHELKDLSTSEALLSEETGGQRDTSKETKEMQEFQSSTTSILLAADQDDDDGDNSNVEHADPILPSAPSKRHSLFQVIRAALFRGDSVLPTKHSQKYMHMEEETATKIGSSTATTNETEPTKVGMKAVLLIFKERSVIVSILLLALASLCVVAVDELFPLWASNKPPVGLGISFLPSSSFSLLPSPSTPYLSISYLFCVNIDLTFG